MAAVKVYCDLCERTHSTDWQRAMCMTARQVKAMRKVPHSPEGSRDIWLGTLETYHNFNWKEIQKVIMARDGYTCQDCGLQHRFIGHEDGKHGFSKSGLEVHHIIPRGMGGTNHPANLKVVCQECHKKYNEEFNPKIISQKANERKAKRLKVKRIDGF